MRFTTFVHVGFLHWNSVSIGPFLRIIYVIRWVQSGSLFFFTSISDDFHAFSLTFVLRNLRGVVWKSVLTMGCVLITLEFVLLPALPVKKKRWSLRLWSVRRRCNKLKITIYGFHHCCADNIYFPTSTEKALSQFISHLDIPRLMSFLSMLCIIAKCWFNIFSYLWEEHLDLIVLLQLPVWCYEVTF